MKKQLLNTSVIALIAISLAACNSTPAKKITSEKEAASTAITVSPRKSYAKHPIATLFKENKDEVYFFEWQKDSMQKRIFVFDSALGKLADTIVVRQDTSLIQTYQEERVLSPKMSVYNGAIIVEKAMIQSEDTSAFCCQFVAQLFYSLAPAKDTEVSVNWELDDHHNWLGGYHGLAIATPTTGGKKIYFRRLEDAAAILCGALLNRNRLAADNEFGSETVFLAEMVARKWLTLQDLVVAEKTNDVPFIVGKILKIPQKNVGSEQLRFIIRMFDETFRKGLYKNQLQQIIKMRGEKEQLSDDEEY